MKISVYDLDGTLLRCNSHIDIVDRYSGRKIYGSILGRVLAFILPNLFIRSLNDAYNRIPDEYIKRYKPEFRFSCLSQLRKDIIEGYETIVISNAPTKILDAVSKEINVRYLYAPVGEKLKVLKQEYECWEYLIVTTDNLSDRDLISEADKAIVYTNKRRLSKFQALKTKGTMMLLDYRTEKLRDKIMR